MSPNEHTLELRTDYSGLGNVLKVITVVATPLTLEEKVRAMRLKAHLDYRSAKIKISLIDFFRVQKDDVYELNLIFMITEGRE